MFDEPRQKMLFEKVKKYFEVNKPDCLHNIDHIIRVVFWAKLLSQEENADSSITIPAAILHDIAIPKYGDANHAKKGAEMCRPFLKECGYSEEEIEKIAEAISMHSVDDPRKPETLEACVLFDADKLDATGPAALYRWLAAYAKAGLMQHEALQRMLGEIQKLKKNYCGMPFFTRTGKQIGKKRFEYLEEKCREILKDLERFKEAYKEL